MKYSILILLSTWMSSSFANKLSLNVVYGEDNRKDFYQVTNSLHKRLANSTAGMVSTTALTKNLDGSYYLNQITSLERAFNICASEKFSQQPAIASCSGFLVSDDTLVTAGHCMDKFAGEDPCKSNFWVFDLKMTSPDEINLDVIPEENVFRCKKVIKSVFDNSQDFAVIKLDRSVSGRKPLRYRKSGKVAKYSQLVVMGHPTMMPLKIADGGYILKNDNPYQFTTSLDTFQGNSGSAVFDARTGMLEGILVSGKTDYMPSNSHNPNSCQIVNVCDQKGNNCKSNDTNTVNIPGENVTRITTLTKYLQ